MRDDLETKLKGLFEWATWTIEDEPTSDAPNQYKADRAERQTAPRILIYILTQHILEMI